jgi:hypothetical protein
MADKTATSKETREELLTRAIRTSVPIRNSFVQLTTPGGGPGPLSRFVSQRRGFALDLYLLFHAVASGGDFSVRRHSAIWARALGIPQTAHGRSRVSRAWAWLEREGLIRRERDRRLVKVHLLQEDASRKRYRHPAKAGHYFQLPHVYWTDDWFLRLTLPAKAGLLILLSRPPAADLPLERAAKWYGVSADTLGRGLRELQAANVVAADVVQRKAPLSPLGHTWEYHYTLLPPFGRARKRAGRRRGSR